MMDKENTTVDSFDQLYHIFKTDKFTFCLICLEDISSCSDNVRYHLSSKNHTENIKLVFKACNPSLVDEVEDERFADIVFKSVFHISVLLENETCYISKRGKYIFCLMCEQKTKVFHRLFDVESNIIDAAVKGSIIEHVLSDSHVKKVKGVCFLYRLSTNQDYLLLNKNVVYCSICKDVIQCQDVDLLKTAVVHLEMKHPNCTKSSGFQCRTSDYFSIKNIPKTHLAEKVNDENCDDINIGKCLVGVGKCASMHNEVPNHEDVKPFYKNGCFKEGNICSGCDLCASKLGRSMWWETKVEQDKLSLEEVMQSIAEIRRDKKGMVSSFNKSYENLNSRLNQTMAAVKFQTEEIKVYRKKLEYMESENKTLKKTVSVMETRLKDIDLSSRMNSLKIQGTLKGPRQDVVEMM